MSISGPLKTVRLWLAFPSPRLGDLFWWNPRGGVLLLMENELGRLDPATDYDPEPDRVLGIKGT